MNRSLVDFTWRGGSLRDRARLHAGGMPMGVRLRSVALLGSGMSWPMPYAASSTLHPQRVAHRWFGMSVTAAHRVLGTRTDATENEIREVPNPDPNPNPYPNRNPDPYPYSNSTPTPTDTLTDTPTQTQPVTVTLTLNQRIRTKTLTIFAPP